MIEIDPLHAHVRQMYQNLLPPPPPSISSHQTLDFVNGSSIFSLENPNMQRSIQEDENPGSPIYAAVYFLFDVITYPFAVVYYSLCSAFQFVSNFVKNWLRDGSFSGAEYIPQEQLVEVLPNFSMAIPQLDAEVQEVARGYRVNLQKMKEPPVTLNLAEIVQNAGGGAIPLDEILVHFDVLFAGRTEYNNIPVFSDRSAWRLGILNLEAPSMKSLMRQYVNFVNNQIRFPGVTSPLYFDNMTLMFQGIIGQLRNPAVSDDKKRQVLFELSQGFECAPRRYAEAERQFRFICNIPGMADDILRRWFMEYKHNIILERFQKDEFHVLSYAIETIGPSWGLSDGVPLGENDAFRKIGHRCKPEHFDRILNEGCVPDRVIHFIESKMDIDRGLNGRPIREENIIGFWQSEIAQAHAANLITDAEAYGELYPLGDRPLTPKGIAFMLHRAGFLDRV